MIFEALESLESLEFGIRQMRERVCGFLQAPTRNIACTSPIQVKRVTEESCDALQKFRVDRDAGAHSETLLQPFLRFLTCRRHDIDIYVIIAVCIHILLGIISCHLLRASISYHLLPTLLYY